MHDHAGGLSDLRDDAGLYRPGSAGLPVPLPAHRLHLLQALPHHRGEVPQDAGADRGRPGTEKLELTGKRRRVQKRLTLLEMWLDQKTSLPAAIKVTMADGATTLWEFSNMKVNPTEVTASLFELKVPKDTIIQSEEDPHSPLINDLLEEEEEEASGAAQAGTASNKP